MHPTPAQLRALNAGITDGELPDAPLPAPVRRKRNNHESQMQRALIRWWDANARAKFGLSPLLLFSIPNGFNGDARRGSVMKAEGQRKGCPDLMLAVPRIRPDWSGSMEAVIATEKNRDCHALFLELKTPTGRLAPEQEAYHGALRGQGYRVVVCRTLEECVKAITEYLA